MVLVDANTGAEAEPVVVDRISGRRVDGPDYVFTAGPAASTPFRDRYQGRPTPAPTRTSASDRELEPDGDAREERILSRVRRIPEGRVRTFGDIDPQAPRIVGQVLHWADDDVPWHRVVRADGTIPMGDHQRQLLVAEGVPMRGDRVDLRTARAVDLGAYLQRRT